MPDRATRLTPGPGLVWGRATVLGAVGLATGAGSHLLGGGRLPHAAVLLVLLAVSVAVSTRFLLGWASATRLVVLVVLAQSGWHLVLSVLAGHAGDPSTRALSAVPAAPTLPGGGGRTGSLHDAYLATVPTTAAAPVGTAAPGEGLLAHQVDHLLHQGLPMVLAHLLGAALLGLFLARGEAALWHLLLLAATRTAWALAGLRALAATRPLPPVVARAATTPDDVPAVASQVLARGPLSRRGPPVLLAA